MQTILCAISNYKAIQLSFGLSHHLFKTKSTCLHKLGVYSQSELLRCFPHLLRIQNDECVKHPRSSVNVYTKRGGGLRLGTNLKVTWVNNMAASGGKWRIFCRVSLAVLFLVILNCELIYTTKPTIAVKQSMPLTSGKYTCRDVYIYTSI